MSNTDKTNSPSNGGSYSEVIYSFFISQIGMGSMAKKGAETAAQYIAPVGAKAGSEAVAVVNSGAAIAISGTYILIGGALVATTALGGYYLYTNYHLNLAKEDTTRINDHRADCQKNGQLQEIIFDNGQIKSLNCKINLSNTLKQEKESCEKKGLVPKIIFDNGQIKSFSCEADLSSKLKEQSSSAEESLKKLCPEGSIPNISWHNDGTIASFECKESSALQAKAQAYLSSMQKLDLKCPEGFTQKVSFHNDGTMAHFQCEHLVKTSCDECFQQELL